MVGRITGSRFISRGRRALYARSRSMGAICPANTVIHDPAASATQALTTGATTDLKIYMHLWGAWLLMQAGASGSDGPWS